MLQVIVTHDFMARAAARSGVFVVEIAPSLNYKSYCEENRRSHERIYGGNFGRR